jgi:hypothetical protein
MCSLLGTRSGRKICSKSECVLREIRAEAEEIVGHQAGSTVLSSIDFLRGSYFKSVRLRYLCCGPVAKIKGNLAVYVQTLGVSP